jgi:hypothetical protein
MRHFFDSAPGRAIEKKVTQFWNSFSSTHPQSLSPKRREGRATDFVHKIEKLGNIFSRRKNSEVFDKINAGWFRFLLSNLERRTEEEWLWEAATPPRCCRARG